MYVYERISMPSTSEKQEKFMAAVAHNPEFAKEVGVPQKVGKEFNKADKAKKELKQTNERLVFMKRWTTVLTNEGLFDFLGKFNKHKPLTDEQYETIASGSLSDNVKAYLDKTILNQDWKTKNLQEPVKVASKYAFVDGVNQPDISKVISHLQGMHKSSQELLAKLKDNTALRQKLCKEIISCSDSDRADKAQELYEANEKKLNVNLVAKAGRLSINGLVASSSDAQWPCDGNTFVWLDRGEEPKDCHFIRPDESAADKYVKDIQTLLTIIEITSKAIHDNTIPYWDAVEFDVEPSNIDEIQEHIFSGQKSSVVTPTLGVRHLAGQILKEMLQAL